MPLGPSRSSRPPADPTSQIIHSGNAAGHVFRAVTPILNAWRAADSALLPGASAWSPETIAALLDYLNRSQKGECCSHSSKMTLRVSWPLRQRFCCMPHSQTSGHQQSAALLVNRLCSWPIPHPFPLSCRPIWKADSFAAAEASKPAAHSSAPFHPTASQMVGAACRSSRGCVGGPVGLARQRPIGPGVDERVRAERRQRTILLGRTILLRRASAFGSPELHPPILKSQDRRQRERKAVSFSVAQVLDFFPAIHDHLPMIDR